jgi:hypothetical protein
VTSVLSTPSTRRRLGVASTTGLVALTTVGVLAGLTSTAQAATAVDLGTATSFGVLAGSAITVDGPVGTTTVEGDLGVHPEPPPAVTGSENLTLPVRDRSNDPAMPGVKDDLVTAYGVAAAATPTRTVAKELGGLTFTAGVYRASSELGLTGPVTLDAEGDADAVFIFQAPSSTLVTAADSRVVLANDAQACNVFWQVGSSATLGERTDFAGNILALTSITLTTDATVEGRVLARNGAVTLDENLISQPGCDTEPVVTTSPTPPTTPPATPPSSTRPTSAGPTAVTSTPPTSAGPTAVTSTPPTSARRSGTTHRTTYGQVGRVPVGSVDTGDGSTS